MDLGDPAQRFSFVSDLVTAHVYFILADESPRSEVEWAAAEMAQTANSIEDILGQAAGFSERTPPPSSEKLVPGEKYRIFVACLTRCSSLLERLRQASTPEEAQWVLNVFRASIFTCQQAAVDTGLVDAMTEHRSTGGAVFELRKPSFFSPRLLGALPTSAGAVSVDDDEAGGKRFVDEVFMELLLMVHLFHHPSVATLKSSLLEPRTPQEIEFVRMEKRRTAILPEAVMPFQALERLNVFCLRQNAYVRDEYIDTARNYCNLGRSGKKRAVMEAVFAPWEQWKQVFSLEIEAETDTQGHMAELQRWAATSAPTTTSETAAPVLIRETVSEQPAISPSSASPSTPGRKQHERLRLYSSPIRPAHTESAVVTVGDALAVPTGLSRGYEQRAGYESPYLDPARRRSRRGKPTPSAPPSSTNAINVLTSLRDREDLSNAERMLYEIALISILPGSEPQNATATAASLLLGKSMPEQLSDILNHVRDRSIPHSLELYTLETELGQKGTETHGMLARMLLVDKTYCLLYTNTSARMGASRVRGVSSKALSPLSSSSSPLPERTSSDSRQKVTRTTAWAQRISGAQ